MKGGYLEMVKYKEVSELDELNEDDEENKGHKAVNEDSGEFIKLRTDSLWKYSAFVLLAIVIIGGFFMFRGNVGGLGNSGTGNVIVNPPQQQLGVGGKVQVSVDDDAILGDKNAPIALIEFSDYQCPFCRRFFNDALPQIKSNYIDTGKVKLVYRDFPLSFHPGAQPAAEGAECVRGQSDDDGYFKMHDKIFEEQNKQGQGTAEFSAEDIKKWAKELGYDINNCLDSGKFRNEVQKDLADATASGGQGTPYFVIIGKDGETIPLSGAQPFNSFDAALKSAGA